MIVTKPKNDDRLLTEAEYNEFMDDCDRLSLAEDLEQLETVVKAQYEKIEAQRIYIKMLEDMNGDRSDKLLKLQENLEQLEKELIKLRCLK